MFIFLWIYHYRNTRAHIQIYWLERRVDRPWAPIRSENVFGCFFGLSLLVMIRPFLCCFVYENLRAKRDSSFSCCVSFIVGGMQYYNAGWRIKSKTYTLCVDLTIEDFNKKPSCRYYSWRYGCQWPARSCKADDFHFIWKPICYFLLVINSNLRPISHCLATIALKVIQGRWFYLIWQSVCRFLLLINSNLSRIFQHFRDMASFPLKMHIFYLPFT